MKQREPEPQDLTQSLRRLAFPPREEAMPLESGNAVLVTRDPFCMKWGTRWLGQSNFDVRVLECDRGCLGAVRSQMPDVVLIDAALVIGGKPLYQTLLDAADVDAAIIVLCTSSKQVTEALDCGAFDVARKPFEWRSIGHRARQALELVRSRRMLSQREGELDKSREIVAAAHRRIRSSRTIEPVTGLPNRAKFTDLLQRGMQASERDGSVLGVFVIGFTRFRLVIEAMGQEQANTVLAEIGRNLADSLRTVSSELVLPAAGLSTAAIACIDQARFGIMLTCGRDAEVLDRVRQTFLDTLSKPLVIRGQAVHLSACVGIAIYPQDADTVDSLLQRADNAMRTAQSRGGGFRYYNAQSDRAAARKLEIENRLYEAMERRDLALHYQPITTVREGKIEALEALLRWRTADGEELSPDEFVPIAEESGLIISIGEYVIDEACRQLAAWRESGLDVPRVCVNVARAQVISANLPAVVHSAIARHGIRPEELELEICERGVLNGDAEVVERLKELRALGISLSIDDFGTGDSAIGYLKDLPVDVLKIDRSYIADTDERTSAMAAAMVVLGQKLGLRVIAEGVETAAQLDMLKRVGCNAYQGFLQSRPLSAEDFAAWYREHAGHGASRAPRAI